MTFAAQRGSSGSANNGVANGHKARKCPAAAGGVQRRGILGMRSGGLRVVLT
jgi:hypothetical protein